MIGYLAVFVGVLGFSGRALFARHMGKTVTAQSTLILCNIVVGLTGVLGTFLHPSAGGIETRAILVFALSGSMSALGGILYFRALQNTLSTNVAQLHYTQIIFGAIFGYILWGEIPTWNLIVGSLIIIASGMFLAAQARKNKDIAC
jgi:drug/metabolite transporter (DMT)-like permease